MSATVTIRPAGERDRAAIAAIAELDSARPPAEPLLVALLDEELLAAISLADATVVANPFRPTLAVVELLVARERQLRTGGVRRWALSRRSLRRLRAFAPGF